MKYLMDYRSLETSEAQRSNILAVGIAACSKDIAYGITFRKQKSLMKKLKDFFIEEE